MDTKLKKSAEEYFERVTNDRSYQGFIDGWLKCKENTYTEEQVREAIDMAENQAAYYGVSYPDEIIQSLKQPK